MSVLLLLVVPVVTAAATLVMRRDPRLQGWVAVAGLVVTFLAGVGAAVAGPEAAWRWSTAIELRLAVEGFARVMVVLVPAIATAVVAYAAATEEDGRGRLLALLVTFVAAMLLLVVAADLLTLLIGWELVGATSWALIAHQWHERERPAAAAHAFVTTRIGDLGLYVAAGAAFAAVGTFGYQGLAEVPRPALDVVAAGVLLAAAAKSAQLPFAPWLFSAMAGPTPVSALLHSATLVAAGAYALIRLAPAFAPVEWFGPATVAVGLATALAGGLVAATQSDAKRLLAGSTSAQHGLMFVAVGSGFTAAAGAHLVAHAGFKSLLFLVAGVAIRGSGSGRLAEMRLGRLLPQFALLSAIGALALAAVPPLGAAWTKERVLAAAVRTSDWVAVGVLAAGFLGALYAARFHLLAYGREGTVSALGTRPGRGELAGAGGLATLTVALSVLWLPGTAGWVETATGGHLAATAPWELLASIAVIAAAAAVAWFSQRRGVLDTLALPAGARAFSAAWFGLPNAARSVVVDPVSRLGDALARFDERAIDAGVVGLARAVTRLSTAVWRWAEGAVDAVVRGVAAAVSGLATTTLRGPERAIDGAVRAIAAASITAAASSRVADERAIDEAVEATARAVGTAGHHSRRLQTGMAHHYYVIAAVGVVGSVVLLALLR
jgi:NADH-quinone oxidoreductase subunit L